jgi:integrase
MSGTGSIFKLTTTLPDGRKRIRYRAQVSTGARGSRQFRTRTTLTRDEAKAELRKLLDDVDAGRRPTTLSLGQYLRHWLDDSARPTISPNTWRGYDDVLTSHLGPIADIPLQQLTAEDIERALGAMRARRYAGAARDMVDLGPASPKTVRNAQLMLRRALGQAEQRGHVRRNVARQVPLRRVPRQDREAMTPALARRILAVTEGDPFEAVYALALVGLRASEILGLRRSDLHLDAKVPTVDVRVQLVGSGRRARLAQLKSQASEAPLPLPAFVAERLRRHLEAQPATLADALVFTTRDGYALNGTGLTKRFAAQLVASGLPRLTLHGLRHGLASILAGLGVHPSIAQRLLRHASARTTLDVYTRVSIDQLYDAVDRYDQAVAG